MKNLFDRNLGIYSDNEILKIKELKVAIVGLGCTGSIVAEFLARVGVQDFTLVDGDKYDITNLNRQIIATLSTLEQNKAEAAAKRILDINKKCKVKHFSEYLTFSNAKKIFSDRNFIVNGLDDPFTMVLLHRTAQKMGIDSIFLLSGIVPFQGICTIIEKNNPIDYETLMTIPTRGMAINKNQKYIKRDLFNKITLGRLSNALKRGAISGKWVEIRKKGGPMISNGITSNVVGLIATNEIIKFIIKRPGLPYTSAPKILYFDGAKNLLKVKTPPKGKYWFQGDF